jgi:hypothetical protein
MPESTVTTPSYTTPWDTIRARFVAIRARRRYSAPVARTCGGSFGFTQSSRRTSALRRGGAGTVPLAMRFGMPCSPPAGGGPARRDGVLAMNEERQTAEEIIPVIEEQVVIGTERATTGTVRVRR